MTTTTPPPAGLAAGGRSLWTQVTTEHDLDPAQTVLLTEACRLKDRCDRLDALDRGHTDTLATVPGIILAAEAPDELATRTANTLKQLLAALRLPDNHGRRPGRRPPRGAYRPRGVG